jgi:hypothetical protein
MIASREVRIGIVTIYAASIREARALGDALPAALERAFRDASRLSQAQPAGAIDAGSIPMPAAAWTLPARLAEQIVAAAVGQGAQR